MMRIRVRILLVLVLVMGAIGSASASSIHVGGTSGTFQFYYERSSGSTYEFNFATVIRRAGAIDPTAGSPALSVRALAGRLACDFTVPICDYTSMSEQDVALDAFTMDPAGNSGKFTACLTAPSGPCRKFDLTISHPRYTQPCIDGCLTPNPWVDLTAGRAGASTGYGPSVMRSGYDVSGLFAGALIGPGANILQALYATALVDGTAVEAP